MSNVAAIEAPSIEYATSHVDTQRAVRFKKCIDNAWGAINCHFRCDSTDLRWSAKHRIGTHGPSHRTVHFCRNEIPFTYFNTSNCYRDYTKLRYLPLFPIQRFAIINLFLVPLPLRRTIYSTNIDRQALALVQAWQGTVGTRAYVVLNNKILAVKSRQYYRSLRSWLHLAYTRS